MTISLPDDPALEQVSMDEIRINLACGLFAAGRVSRGVGARVAGLEQLAFDEELYRREIPSFMSEMLAQDIASLATLR